MELIRYRRGKDDPKLWTEISRYTANGDVSANFSIYGHALGGLAVKISVNQQSQNGQTKLAVNLGAKETVEIIKMLAKELEFRGRE